MGSDQYEITTLPMPPEPPSTRGHLSGNSGSGGGGGGSILGICARSNSLNRGASQHIRSSSHHSHSHHSHGGCSGMRPPDIEGLSEKYWGEILERTVSSNSLHAMQKNFPHHQHHSHLMHHITSQHHANAGNGNTPTMTTSFSKHSDLNLTQHEKEYGMGLSGMCASNTAASFDSELNGKFSSSEPKLCEHMMLHEAGCAKNKSDIKESNKLSCGRSIPDI